MAGAVEWMIAPAPALMDSAVPGNLYVSGEFDKVVDPASNSLPFLTSAQGVQFFAPTTGFYRLVHGKQERILVVDAPPLPMQRWQPSADELDSSIVGVSRSQSDNWWKWLVLLAMVALWVEWRLFYVKGGYVKGGRGKPFWKRAIQVE